MFDKRCKAVDVSRGTNIRPSVISRYLSGTNQPSTGKLFAIANYLGVSSEWLLSSSEAPESKKPAHNISTHQEKIIELLERMVAEKDEQIISLKAEIKQWEDMAITISEKNRQKTKNPTKPNKQKVGFMKKHKKPKS
jgi:transcriptional regulator with XRE-family HTH domain